jgi:glutamine amidotransferase
VCRWLAYSGNPIPIDLLVFKSEHSLIDQSLHSRMGATTTNGDGFGLGWYSEGDGPAVYRSVHPAWNDRNLRELAANVSSRLFFAHIRASTGTAVQETNTHPFRYGRWLFMHNGLVRDFPKVRRDMLLTIDPSLLPAVEGSTDSELLFYLALTFGLDDDAVAALERMAGFVEDLGERHEIDDPLQMSVAVSDGERIVVARYSSERRSRTLFFSTDTRTLKALYPHSERAQLFADDARAIVSEPLSGLPGVWNAVPESHLVVVQSGEDDVRHFNPRRG